MERCDSKDYSIYLCKPRPSHEASGWRDHQRTHGVRYGRGGEVAGGGEGEEDRNSGAAGGMGRDLFGGDVEVVGRLVEDQQIGGLQHHPAQRHAGLLASLQRVQACKRHVTAVAATPEP